MDHHDNEAFSWWAMKNGQEKSSSSKVKIPKFSSIDELVKFWRFFSPQFLLLEKYVRKKERYFYCVESMLYSICNDTPPSILNEFPQFVAFLYNYRKILSPKTVSDCCNLYNTCKYPKNIWFISQQFPIMVNNPLLMFETMLRWREKSSKAWKIIVASDESAATIVDHYLSFYSEIYFPQSSARHKPQATSHSTKTSKNRTGAVNVTYKNCVMYRFFLLDIVMSIILTRKKKGGDVDQLCVDVINQAINNLSLLSLELAANITRCVFQCFSFLSNSCSEKKELYTKFLAASSGTGLYMMVSKYYLMMKEQPIESNEAIKCITKITCLEDLKYVEMWMNSFSGLQIATLLLDAAYRGALYNRCAIQILCTYIKKFPLLRVKKLLTAFIRRSFVFIARCSLSSRNKTQVDSILCNFATLQKQAPWLQELVSSCAGSLVKTKTAPKSLKYFIKPVNQDSQLTKSITEKVRIVIIKKKPRKKAKKNFKNSRAVKPKGRIRGKN